MFLINSYRITKAFYISKIINILLSILNRKIIRKNICILCIHCITCDCMVEIKRKLYKRGSSFETTIPMPLLFAVDKTKKQQVVFKFDEEAKEWYIELEAK